MLLKSILLSKLVVFANVKNLLKPKKYTYKTVQDFALMGFELKQMTIETFVEV